MARSIFHFIVVLIYTWSQNWALFLFNIYFNDFDSWTEHTLSKFAEAKKQGVIDVQDGCSAIQKTGWRNWPKGIS